MHFMTITRILCAACIKYGLYADDFHESYKNYYANKEFMHNQVSQFEI